VANSSGHHGPHGWPLQVCGVLAVVATFAGLATISGSAATAGATVARHRSAFLQSDDPVYEGQFADPSVLVVGGTYYAYSTNAGDENIPVIESTDLVHWSDVGDAMPLLPSWVEDGFTWSPSVAVDPAGGYELFYTAYDPAKHHECIGRATGPSPLGPFVDAGTQPFLCDTALGGAIDPSIYQTQGADYLVWKSDGETGQLKQILAQRLGPGDRSLAGSSASLALPDQSWEDGNIEGPALASINGAVYLFFTGNNWTSPNYAIDYFRCSSPLGPCSAAGLAPLLGSTASAIAPGGPDLFTVSGHVLLAYSAVPGGSSEAGGDQRRLYLTEISPLGDGALGVGA
jgi:beta-xylosidase